MSSRDAQRNSVVWHIRAVRTGLGLVDKQVFESHERASKRGGPPSSDSSSPKSALRPFRSRHAIMASSEPPSGGSSLLARVNESEPGSVVCGLGGISTGMSNSRLVAGLSALLPMRF